MRATSLKGLSARASSTRLAGSIAVVALCWAMLGCGDDDPKASSDTTGTDTAETTDSDAGDQAGDQAGDEAGDTVAVIDVHVPGLSAPVTVTTDHLGIPHIVGATDEDVLAVEGYVHASQRFVTMDLARRQVTGRLATALGSAMVESDVYHRQLMSTRDGQPLEVLLWEQADGPTRAALTAYARGVNAFLADVRAGRNGATLTGEYALLGSDNIPDWQETDTMALVLSMFQMLSMSHDLDLLRGEAAAALAPEVAGDIFTLRPATTTGIAPSAGIGNLLPFQPVVLDREAVRMRLHPALGAIRQARALLDRIPGHVAHNEWDLGSNNWVLGPSRVASGTALLANDPHLGLSNPPIWFWVELDSMSQGTGTLHVAGASIPAAPGVVIGRNENIAWGVTVANYDLTDVYVETLNADGSAVLFEGAEVPLVRRDHTFEVRSGEAVVKTLEWVPHHGPILSRDGNTATSLRWVATEGATDLTAFLGLNRAANVDEALTAIRAAYCANQNFIVADRDGKIAWHPHVHVPRRDWATANLAPWLPLPGDGSAEWGDWVADSELPLIVDPPNGFVATANHAFDDHLLDGDPTNDGAQPLQNEVAAGYRGTRIVELLQASTTHDVDSMLAVQADIHSLFGQTIVPHILDAATAKGDALTPAAVKVRDALATWDYACPTGLATSDPDGAKDSDAARSAAAIGCLAFHATVYALVDAAFDDELSAAGMSSQDIWGAAILRVLTHLLDGPGDMLAGEVLWDDVSTAGVTETRDDVVAIALDVAGQQLTERLGANPDDWRWGRVHTLTLESIFGDAFAGLNIGPVANDGGMGTVDVAHPRRDYSFGSGPSLRIVNTLGADGIETWAQFPGGQDLHRESPHYRDWLEPWLANQAVKFPFTRAEADAAAEATLTVQP